MKTLQSDSTQKRELPEWVLATAALTAITVILTFVLYKATAERFIAKFAAMTGAPVEFSFDLFFGDFVFVAALVSWIAFLIYVFNWLREGRALLRQIEINTRTPKVLPQSPEQKREAAVWPSPPTPLIPPENAKYMPKG